jgi:hypothetical protein
MIDAQYNTFEQVLAHYHTCGKVSLTPKEVKAIIPQLDRLIEANLNFNKQPSELTARLKHNDDIYYVKANIQYFPLIEESLGSQQGNSDNRNSNFRLFLLQSPKPSISYMTWVKLIWR